MHEDQESQRFDEVLAAELRSIRAVASWSWILNQLAEMAVNDERLPLAGRALLASKLRVLAIRERDNCW